MQIALIRNESIPYSELDNQMFPAETQYEGFRSILRSRVTLSLFFNSLSIALTIVTYTFNVNELNQKKA